MDFVSLLESVSVDDIENGDLMDSVINDHYHKARIIQRSLAQLTEEEKAGIGSCYCYIHSDEVLCVDMNIKQMKKTETIEESLQSYVVEENFDLEVVNAGNKLLTIRVRQLFTGQEDDVIYAD